MGLTLFLSTQLLVPTEAHAAEAPATAPSVDSEKTPPILMIEEGIPEKRGGLSEVPRLRNCEFLRTTNPDPNPDPDPDPDPDLLIMCLFLTIF